MPFTVVFEGDVTKFKKNPFDFESVFGRVHGISKLDLIAENERLREALENMKHSFSHSNAGEIS